ncbi:T9SS type A sorting domain-containing protein [candidate division KSB1 bacterium]|nr:T9SS type A sorting domain-containing protein [candidate division KSB1 bacterium]
MYWLKWVSAWKAGEKLIVQFRDLEKVLLEEIEVPLSYNPDDQAGEVNLDEMNFLPSRFHLGQNYPNPFNPSTIINVAVPRSSQVRVVVYNIQGQIVRILKDGDMTAGFHQVVWDGHDDMGRSLGNGVYLIQMEGVNFIQRRKALYIK